jgi:NitT/TauT family transport system substrate-binding protein
MTTFKLSRRHAAGLMLGGTAAGSLGIGRARAQTLEKVIYQTGWRAQAEHGGYYQAVATGLYKQAGLDVEVRQGGPQMDANALLLAGRTDFIEGNLFGAFNYAREKLPGLALAAFFQKDMRVLLSHPGVGNDSLPALKGKPMLIATAGRQSYWEWLKAKYGYTDDQARPYTFNMAPFLADKNLTQQGFLTSEPYVLHKAGVDPVVHLLADNGFDNYQGVLMCQPKLAAEKPELVQRFVDATIKGWASYLKGDASPGNELIKRDNPDMTDDKIAYAIEIMNKSGLVGSGDAVKMGVGAMTAERWHSFYKDMVAVGAQPAGLDIDRIFTLKFTNKKVGFV